MSLFSSRRHIFWNIFRVSLLVLVLAGAGLVAVRLRTPPPAHASAAPCDFRAFIQITTTDNSFSGAKFTRIDWSGLDGDPQAILQVTPLLSSPAYASDNHPIGVFYYSSHWYIFNEDGTPMPMGTAFNVFWQPGPGHDFCVGSGVVQTATSTNTLAGDTYIDQPGLDGQSSAVPLVTSNWNPGGSAGVSDPHPIGVGYDTFRERWYIFNEDGTPIPAGASFNVNWDDSDSYDFNGVFQVTSSNSIGNFTWINLPQPQYDQSYDMVWVTPAFVFNPLMGGSHGVYENHNLGVFWNGSYWCISNQDYATMPTGATFFIRIF